MTTYPETVILTPSKARWKDPIPSRIATDIKGNFPDPLELLAEVPIERREVLPSRVPHVSPLLRDMGLTCTIESGARACGSEFPTPLETAR